MNNKLHSALFGAFAVAAAGVSFADPYVGNIYWSSQGNNGFPFGDVPQFSRLVSGTMTAFESGAEIDWANSDVYLDAQYTADGVNYINAATGTFTVKSLTVADNWDGSGTYGGNKGALWFGGVLGGQENSGTLNVTGFFTIKSAINFSETNYSLTLNTGGIVIDVPTTPESRSRDVRLKGYNKITTANDFIVTKAASVDLSFTKESFEVGGNFIANSITGNLWLNNIGTISVANDFTLNGVNYANFNDSKILIGGDFSATNGIIEMHTSQSARIDGNFTINSSTAIRFSTGVGINGGTASIDNPNFYVGEKITLNGYNETFTSGARNGGKMFIRSSGLNGTANMGFVWQNENSTNEVTHILYNSDTSEMITSLFSYGRAEDASSANLNFVMNGTGTQILRVGDDGGDYKWNWRGKITVNNGKFMLGNTSNSLVDVEIGSNGSFGGVGLTAGENVRNITVQNLTIADGGKLIFNYDGSSFVSEIFVNELLTINGDLGVYINGENLGEGSEIYLMSWSDNYEAENTAALNGAFGSDAASVYVNGVQYAVAEWSADYNEFYIKLGEVIPEPAEVAALIGLVALAFAAYRRRK